MYKNIFFIFCFCFACFFSVAQLRWKPVKQDSLPAGLKLFTTKGSLNGRPFIAYYAEANLKNKKLEFTTQVGNGQRYTPSQFYTREGLPHLVVNGTFFSFATNQNLNVIIRDGKILGYNFPALKSRASDSFYYPTRSAIGISKNRRADVAWIFTDTAQRWPYAFQSRPIVARGKTNDPSLIDLNTIDPWKWWKMKTAIGGGPVLVQEGKINITNQEEQMFVNGLADLHPRTAMGYTKDRKLIILVVQGRDPGIAEGATLAEEAKILADLGCYEALNLDGGGSSCMLVNGKETIKPSDKEGQRPVPGVFIIRHNQ
ncbi:MAG: phosphodiester glycosidase family protein [Chitinophagaceae bacterium]|nr:phosphodiester glycosidase family protein [Chitinophagaceae bacterium]